MDAIRELGRDVRAAGARNLRAGLEQAPNRPFHADRARLDARVRRDAAEITPLCGIRPRIRVDLRGAGLQATDRALAGGQRLYGAGRDGGAAARDAHASSWVLTAARARS